MRSLLCEIVSQAAGRTSMTFHCLQHSKDWHRHPIKQFQRCGLVYRPIDWDAEGCFPENDHGVDIWQWFPKPRSIFLRICLPWDFKANLRTLYRCAFNTRLSTTWFDLIAFHSNFLLIALASATDLSYLYDLDLAVFVNIVEHGGTFIKAIK